MVSTSETLALAESKMKQMARVKALFHAIQEARETGYSLVDIHAYLIEKGLYNGSCDSLRSELSRISKMPPTISTSGAPESTISTKPTQPEPAPQPKPMEDENDLYKPGMTDKQKREALADHFCAPEKNLDPRIKKYLEKNK